MYKADDWIRLVFGINSGLYKADDWIRQVFGINSDLYKADDWIRLVFGINSGLYKAVDWIRLVFGIHRFSRQIFPTEGRTINLSRQKYNSYTFWFDFETYNIFIMMLC